MRSWPSRSSAGPAAGPLRAAATRASAAGAAGGGRGLPGWNKTGTISSEDAVQASSSLGRGRESRDAPSSCFATWAVLPAPGQPSSTKPSGPTTLSRPSRSFWLRAVLKPSWRVLRVSSVEKSRSPRGPCRFPPPRPGGADEQETGRASQLLGQAEEAARAPRLARPTGRRRLESGQRRGLTGSAARVGHSRPSGTLLAVQLAPAAADLGAILGVRRPALEQVGVVDDARVQDVAPQRQAEDVARERHERLLGDGRRHGRVERREGHVDGEEGRVGRFRVVLEGRERVGCERAVQSGGGERMWWAGRRRGEAADGLEEGGEAERDRRGRRQEVRTTARELPSPASSSDPKGKSSTRGEGTHRACRQR